MADNLARQDGVDDWITPKAAPPSSSAGEDDWVTPGAAPAARPSPDGGVDDWEAPGSHGTSRGGAFVKGGELGVLPAAGGWAGMAAGAKLGALAGAAIPILGETGIGEGIGTFVGGLGGAVAGAGGVAKAEDWLLSKLPESIKEKIGLSTSQREAAELAAPHWFMAGELAPNLALLRPGAVVKTAREGASLLERALSHPIGVRAVGAASMGGLEAGQEAATDRIDPGKIAIAAGFGALSTHETGLGRGIRTGVERAIPKFGAGVRPLATEIPHETETPEAQVGKIMGAETVDQAVAEANAAVKEGARWQPLYDEQDAHIGWYDRENGQTHFGLARPEDINAAENQPPVPIEAQAEAEETPSVEAPAVPPRPVEAPPDRAMEAALATAGKPLEPARDLFMVDPRDIQVDAKTYQFKEGSGTAIDVAKVLRESPDEAVDLPLNKGMNRDGVALAKLGDDAFGMVVNRVVPENYAAFVGRAIADPAQQVSALRELVKADPSNAEEARLIVDQVVAAGFEPGETADMFGSAPTAESLLGERAKILNAARKRLRFDRTTFGRLVSEADRIGETGNVLATEANKARVSEDERIFTAVEKLALMKGEVSDALTDAARNVKNGQSTVANGVTDFLAAVRARANSPEGAVEIGGPANRAGEPDTGIGTGRGAAPVGGEGTPPEGDVTGNIPPLKPHVGSWMIVDRATGKAVTEIFRDSKNIAHLNFEKYEAVPADEYLARFNEPQEQPLFQRREEASPATKREIARETIYPGVDLVFTPKAQERRALVARQLRKQLDRYGMKDVGVRVADSIEHMENGVIRNEDGVYLGKIIHLALDAQNPKSVLSHEVIHAFRRLGIITPEEWSVLEQQARDNWIGRYANKLKGYSDDVVPEEAVAFAHQEWAAGRPTASPLINRIFSRLRDAIRAIRSAFRGQGLPTSESVFGADAVKIFERLERGAEAPKNIEETTPEFQRRDQTETPEFKRWFGDSKVVDENGKPLVVYHGTASRFQSFNPKKAIGGQFWFTTDKASIERGEVGAAGRGHIVEAYLSLKNPAGWDLYDKLTLGELKSRGYDGLALPDSDGEVTYVAFEPTQIKSVFNRGTFDPNDKRIAFQRREDVSNNEPPMRAVYVKSTGKVEMRPVVEMPLRQIEGTGAKNKRAVNEALYNVGEEAPQIERAARFAKTDFDQAVRVAMRQANPPPGIHPEFVYMAVEEKAIADDNIELQRRLNNSKIAEEATAMGQRIAAWRNRNEISPVDDMRAIREAREARAKLRDPAVMEKHNTDIESGIKEIRKQASSTKRPNWDEFIRTLICPS